jgi:ribosomal protein S15P/S13E
MKKYHIIILCSIIVLGIIFSVIILGVGCKDKSSIENEINAMSSILNKLTTINSSLISADADFISGTIDRNTLLNICAKSEVDVGEIENQINNTFIKNEKLKDIMFNLSNLTTSMKKLINYSKEVSKDRYNGYAEKLQYEDSIFNNNLMKIKEKIEDILKEPK